MSEDRTLLSEYALTGSEAAFTELVGRHLDFVYSVALRLVDGDAHLAKDISQTVFIDLARRASKLADREVLEGWLYTSTSYAATNTLRTRQRRQVREQQAHAMQEQDHAAVPEPDWQRLRPVLDAALLGLHESDREALLLRFFSNCTFAELGAKLGLNENAARMRVTRAIEKLRTLLARRGIHSSAAVLSVALAAAPMISAPAGLAASIATTALVSGATSIGLPSLTPFTMSQLKPFAVERAMGSDLNNGQMKTPVVRVRDVLRLRPKAGSSVLIKAMRAGAEYEIMKRSRNMPLTGSPGIEGQHRKAEG